jgi:hypothetical protein
MALTGTLGRSILDAVATDWPTDDLLLFWRAAAAYNIRCDDKGNDAKNAAARQRMKDFLANEAHRTMDAKSVNMMRKFLDNIERCSAESR